MDDLQSLLIEHEGMRFKVYKDIFGNESIGVGRNLAANGISRAEALYMLGNDIAKCKAQLYPYAWFKNLNQVRQEVMIELCFNMGINSLLKFQKMIAYLIAQQWQNAADALMDSEWSKQVAPERSKNIVQRLITGQYAN